MGVIMPMYQQHSLHVSLQALLLVSASHSHLSNLSLTYTVLVDVLLKYVRDAYLDKLPFFKRLLNLSLVCLLYLEC